MMRQKRFLLLIIVLSLSFIGLSKKTEISAADSVNLEKFSPNYTKNGDFEKKTIKQIIQEKISPKSAKNIPPRDWEIYSKSENVQPKDIEFEIPQQEEYQYAGKKSLFVKTNKSDIGLSQNFSKGVDFPSFVQANVLIKKGRMKLALINDNNQEVYSVEAEPNMIMEYSNQQDKLVNEWQRLSLMIPRNSQLVKKIIAYSMESNSEWYITNVNVKKPKDLSRVLTNFGEFSLQNKIEPCKNLKGKDYSNCVKKRTGVFPEELGKTNQESLYYKGEKLEGGGGENPPDTVLGASNFIAVSHAYFQNTFSDQDVSQIINNTTNAWNNENINKGLDFTSANVEYYDPSIPSNCSDLRENQRFYLPDKACSSFNTKAVYVFSSFADGVCMSNGVVRVGMTTGWINDEDFIYTAKHETGHLFASPDTDFVEINGNMIFPEGNDKNDSIYNDIMYSRRLNAEKYSEELINRLPIFVSGGLWHSLIVDARVWDYQVSSFSLINKENSAPLQSGKYKIFLAKQGENHIRGQINSFFSFSNNFYNGTIFLMKYPFSFRINYPDTAAFIIVKTSGGEIFTGKFDLIDVSIANFNSENSIQIQVSRPNFPIDFEKLEMEETDINVQISNVNYFIDNFVSSGKLKARIHFIDQISNEDYFGEFFNVNRTTGIYDQSSEISLPNSTYSVSLQLFNLNENNYITSYESPGTISVNNEVSQINLSFNLFRTNIFGNINLKRNDNFDYNKFYVNLEKQVGSGEERKYYYSQEYLLDNNSELNINYKVLAGSGTYRIYISFKNADDVWLPIVYHTGSVTLGDDEAKNLDISFDLRKAFLSGHFTLLRNGNFNYNKTKVVLEKQNTIEGETKHFYSSEHLLTNDISQSFDYEVNGTDGTYKVYLDFNDGNGNWAQNKYLPGTITLTKSENKILNPTLDIRVPGLFGDIFLIRDSNFDFNKLEITLENQGAQGERHYRSQTYVLNNDAQTVTNYLVQAPAGTYRFYLAFRKETSGQPTRFLDPAYYPGLIVLGQNEILEKNIEFDLRVGCACCQSGQSSQDNVGSYGSNSGSCCLTCPFTPTPSIVPTATPTLPAQSTPTPTPNCSGCHYQSPNLDCTYPYSTPFLNCDRINPSSKCCLAGPTNTPTPTPTRTFSPTPTRVPTSPPTPTPTPLPQFGVCGGCTSDAQGGCTVPPGSHGQCRLLNDASACSQYGRSAPCCLYDEHCDPNFQYQCNESASVYCDKCHRYKNSSPWCSDNFQTDCGWGAPAKPRLKSPSLNQTINFNGQLNLSWYAFSEGLKSGCTSELLPNTWSVWQEDCEGDGSPDTHYGTVPNCKLDPGNERSCWGYTCAKGSFGIPAGWRFYKVFIKLSSLQNFTEICSLTDIPDSSADSGGYGGSLAADKTSCSFTPGQGGTYQWYVRAGYSVTTASGASTNYTDSNISTFTIIAPTNTPTPVPQGTCEYCRIYDQNWNQITNLSAIQLNQHVYLTTRGNTNASTANTKARFRVNQLAASYWCTGTGLTLVGNQWCETTLTHNNMFYVPFWFITSGSHTIESMVYNTSVGWY